MEYKDYYSVLGVDKKATADQIKQSYRRLARKYHPDVSKEPNAEEEFKKVQEAYEVLKDDKKREAYDQLGSQWKSGQEFHRPPNWGGQGQSHSAEDFGGFSGAGNGADFSDFFSELFGRGRGGFEHRGSGAGRGFQQRGADQRAAIHVTLEEAFRGTTKTLQLQVPEADVDGNIKYVNRTLKVTVPPGASQGQQLRLANQGGPGMGGATAGDLYLEINIDSHPLFSLQGRDVYLTLPVTPWEAALGAEIKVPTLGGQVDLKLAPSSQGGQKLRLKGRGFPGKPTAGDQYAILKIEVPPAKTDDQKQFYQKMAETLPFNPRRGWLS